MSDRKRPSRSHVDGPSGVGSCPARNAGTALEVYVQPLADTPIARYGIEALLRVMGVRAKWCEDPTPAIYYGSDPRIGRRAAVWVYPKGDSEGESGAWTLSEIDGVPVVSNGKKPARLWDGRRLEFDVFRATAFWLTLGGERSVGTRDAHGRVPSSASLAASDIMAKRPPVHAYAELLQTGLERTIGRLATGSRWPNDRRYAVAFTHDVDSPERRSRIPGLMRDLVLGAKRTRRESYWTLRTEVKSQGLRETCFARPTKRRAWDFEKICAHERDRGLRSAFYFAVVRRSEGHACDVVYDADRRRFRRLFGELDAAGWEVGLQASYSAGSAPRRIVSQLDRLTKLARRPASGVRHHYLRLDPAEPLQTLAAHAEAGLAYDTTIGFNDIPGFRAGIALPFRPFGDAKDSGSFLELPMTIADMHLPRQDETAAVDSVIAHLETVRSIGGLAVLNWHAGHWYSDPAWRAAYLAACDFVSSDATAWSALPREICRWWQSTGGDTRGPGDYAAATTVPSSTS
ncbi:MAG: hypothetical protein O7D94_07060 [Planctomycetota bacterium]|nr:hypothetical protein [Planctomycetota bacterium]